MSYNDFIKWKTELPLTRSTLLDKPAHRYRTQDHLSFNITSTSLDTTISLPDLISLGSDNQMDFTDFLAWSGTKNFLTFEFTVGCKITDQIRYEQAHVSTANLTVPDIRNYAGQNSGDLCIGIMNFTPNDQFIAYDSGSDDRFVNNNGVMFCGPALARHVLTLKAPSLEYQWNDMSNWVLRCVLPGPKLSTRPTVGLEFHINVTIIGKNISERASNSAIKYLRSNSDFYETAHYMAPGEPWQPYGPEFNPTPPPYDLSLGYFQILTGRNDKYLNFSTNAGINIINNSNRMFTRRASECEVKFSANEVPSKIRSSETHPALYISDSSETVVSPMAYTIRTNESSEVDSHCFVATEYVSYPSKYDGISGLNGGYDVDVSELPNKPNAFDYYTTTSGGLFGEPNTYYTASEYISTDNITVYEKIDVNLSFIEIDIKSAIESINSSERIMKGGKPLFYTIVSIPQKNDAGSGTLYYQQAIYTTFGVFGFNVTNDNGNEIVRINENATHWRQPSLRSDCTIWDGCRALRLDKLNDEVDIPAVYKFGMYVYGGLYNTSNTWQYNNSLIRNPRFIINCWYQR